MTARQVLVGITDEGPFEAIADPAERWNGWLASPTFDRPTVERIAAMLDANLADGYEADRIRWNDDGSLTLDRPTEPDWAGETIRPDADGRYAVGSYAWCWYEWSAE